MGINTHIWPWSRSDEEAPLFLDCDILPQVDGSSNHHNSKFDLDESALAGVLSFFIHHTRGVLGAIEKPKPLYKNPLALKKGQGIFDGYPLFFRVRKRRRRPRVLSPTLPHKTSGGREKPGSSTPNSRG